VDWDFIRGLLILLVVVGIVLIAAALLYEPGGITGDCSPLGCEPADYGEP
jgi:hypothetical protein